MINPIILIIELETRYLFYFFTTNGIGAARKQSSTLCYSHKSVYKIVIVVDKVETFKKNFKLKRMVFSINWPIPKPTQMNKQSILGCLRESRRSMGNLTYWATKHDICLNFLTIDGERLSLEFFELLKKLSKRGCLICTNLILLA